jgi:hypothetical protein
VPHIRLLISVPGNTGSGEIQESPSNNTARAHSGNLRFCPRFLCSGGTVRPKTETYVLHRRTKKNENPSYSFLSPKIKHSTTVKVWYLEEVALDTGCIGRARRRHPRINPKISTECETCVQLHRRKIGRQTRLPEKPKAFRSTGS